MKNNATSRAVARVVQTFLCQQLAKLGERVRHHRAVETDKSMDLTQLPRAGLNDVQPALRGQDEAQMLALMRLEGILFIRAQRVEQGLVRG
ncbi:hypothetical protein GALL_437340 [mine drainage metagenome]|uniref:Uncharacterized protein n=1 Tax=mine drainage metagenome TaxID=410659 RepID=A0A1J5PUS5_9ZZZZ